MTMRPLIERLRGGVYGTDRIALCLEAADELERMQLGYETRPDGKLVSRMRWEWGIRRIVALLWGNRQDFEIDDVVEGVRNLVSRPQAGIDEALVRAVQNEFEAVASTGTLGPAAEAKRLLAHYQQNPQWFGGDEVDQVCALIDAEVAAERERCAAVPRAMKQKTWCADSDAERECELLEEVAMQIERGA